MEEKKKPRRKIKPFRLILILMLLLVFIAGGVGLGYVVGAVKDMPKWDPAKLKAAETTFIYDNEGNLVSKLHIENREEVSLSRMPDHLKNAFLAVEDSKFYEHYGFRIDAIVRAGLANLTGGFGSEGGSTITQQLVKNAYFPKGRKTIERKIQECVLAVQMERIYTKDEILEMYLNRIYFAGSAYGVQAASQYFFGKNVEDLELHESAMLAGMIKSPANYSPFLNPEAAKDRCNFVLERMVETGFITRAQADEYKNKPFNLAQKETKKNYDNQYFIDYVVEQATEILKDEAQIEESQQALFQGGLRIFTTLDTDIQKTAENIYSQDKYFPKGTNGKIVQSAMVVLDPHTGKIKCLVGGRNYSQKRGFNRAVSALRQPGSAFKPIAVYAPALTKGFTPATVIDDTPVSFNAGNGKTYSPKNYDNKFRGPITMRTAVQRSVNIYAVKLLNMIGPAEGLKFAQNLGISTLVKQGKENDLNLSLALGGLTRGVSPLEMAAAYGVFANQGVYVKPYAITKIMDSEGQVLYEHHTQQWKAMDRQSAYLMTSMLQSVMVSPGTGWRANFGWPAAGKTGTTNDDTNAWFVGYTPHLVCAVWMGYDNQNESMYNVFGGNYPATIWKEVMAKAHEDLPVSSFPVPDGLTHVTVCKVSGKLPNGLCPEEELISEIFPQNMVPTEVCDRHVQAEICAESGKLATPYCPVRINQVFVTRDPGSEPSPQDTRTDYLPSEQCNLHQLGNILPGFGNPNNNLEETDSDQNGTLLNEEQIHEGEDERSEDVD